MVALKKGAKLTDSPKDYMLRVRMDKKSVQMLDDCCEKMNLTKSEVVRMGIGKVHAEIEKE